MDEIILPDGGVGERNGWPISAVAVIDQLHQGFRRAEHHSAWGLAGGGVRCQDVGYCRITFHLSVIKFEEKAERVDTPQPFWSFFTTARPTDAARIVQARRHGHRRGALRKPLGNSYVFTLMPAPIGEDPFSYSPARACHVIGFIVTLCGLSEASLPKSCAHETGCFARASFHTAELTSLAPKFQRRISGSDLDWITPVCCLSLQT